MGKLTAKSKNVMQNSHIPPIPFEPADFQRALLDWYDGARRKLPWRAGPGEKADPYKVWLSEIMLQQTTVKAVIPYFETFVARWPAAEALAAASRDEVLAAWAGLGYYSRARNLYACAQALARDGFPANEAGLRALPGVGAYTAAAIAAIAFGEPAAVVDGNVERVIARLFAVEQPFPAARLPIRKLAGGVDPFAPARRLRARDDGPRRDCLHASGAILPGLPNASVWRRVRSRRGRAPFPVKAPKAERPVRRGDAFVIVRTERGDPAHSFAAAKRQGPARGHDEGAVLRVGAGAPLASPPDGNWTEGRTVQHTFTHFHLEMRVLAAHHDEVKPAAEAFGGDWAALANLSAFALPAVMKKAVASGLEALGLDGPGLSAP